MRLLFAIALPLLLPAQEELLYEHRVVVATTTEDRENEIDQSLERNVNQLAAHGYAVSAILGGFADIADNLLMRPPNDGNSIDRSGITLVVMHRPVIANAPAREYRLLHLRYWLGVDRIVARLGKEGFRLAAVSWEGGYFHAAFERIAGQEPVEYRVYRTAKRLGWDKHMMADPAVPLRLQRVVQIFPDFALAELASPKESPAEFVWSSDALHQSTRHEQKLNELAKSGFRVQFVRVRRNELDAALLKPAGGAVPAPAIDLDNGYWGGPCGRGRIAGADAWNDGQVYCIAEDPKGPIMNRGFDLELNPHRDLGGQLFFGRSSCEARARLYSKRPATIRLARALQLESEINRDLPKGYRVAHLFAGRQEGRDQRLVVMGTQAPMEAVAGPPARRGPAPALRVEVEGLGLQLLANEEVELNERLSRELRSTDIVAWVEINNSTGDQHILLTGCAVSRRERDDAVRTLNRLLTRSAFSRYPIRNEMLVEGFR